MLDRPGSSIGLHLHDQRRGHGVVPQVIGNGEAAFEASGISHWWRNEDSTPARAPVVDLVPLETP